MTFRPTLRSLARQSTKHDMTAEQEKRKMLYLLAGGGTGGHLMPGIALAQHIKAVQPDAAVSFAVSDSDRDTQALRRYELDGSAWGARRWTDWIDLPTFATMNSVAVMRALVRMIRLRPDVVVALGGYAAAFPSIAALLLRKPLVLLEQNVIPGRVNRMLARRASLICCQWQESVRSFPITAPVVVTGSPVRRELLEGDPAQGGPGGQASQFAGLADGPPTVLVMGGSQGAHSVNEAMTASLPRLLSSTPHVQFIHLTGRADRAEVVAAYQRANVRACVLDYLEDISPAYRCADVVVSRAGGTSLAEITALGKAAVLIPYPYAADDHQRANARALAHCGAAEMIDPNQLTPDILAAKLETLLRDQSLRRGMSLRAREKSRLRAAADILTHIDNLPARRGGILDRTVALETTPKAGPPIEGLPAYSGPAGGQLNSEER